MPVNPAALASKLTSNFASPGSSFAACAQQWAQAVADYATPVAPPSATVQAAGSALASSLAAAFAIPGGAAPGMEAAFAAFALSVGGGMAGFVPTPPPTPVGFASLVGILTPTHAAAAANVASLIDSWFRKGLATPPSGSPIPWS